MYYHPEEGNNNSLTLTLRRTFYFNRRNKYLQKYVSIIKSTSLGIEVWTFDNGVNALGSSS